ncbi:MAG: disulfide bond formation protein B, partial [Pseudomonadota bacterium]
DGEAGGGGHQRGPGKGKPAPLAPGSDVSADALLEQILEAPVVRCDDVAWSMLGLSLAGWNALLSAGLAALWAASVWWWRMPFDREA